LRCRSWRTTRPEDFRSGSLDQFEQAWLREARWTMGGSGGASRASVMAEERQKSAVSTIT